MKKYTQICCTSIQNSSNIEAATLCRGSAVLFRRTFFQKIQRPGQSNILEIGMYDKFVLEQFLSKPTDVTCRQRFCREAWPRDGSAIPRWSMYMQRITMSCLQVCARRNTYHRLCTRGAKNHTGARCRFREESVVCVYFV
jgi:hypothetical protein